jgi:Uma2 family endonuclease
MSTAESREELEREYAKAAQDYFRRFSGEPFFMEATAQATQRKITLESLDLVHAHRPDVQVFNELLVQYPREGRRKLGQVVPDNMVVICDKPIDANGSYDITEQPSRPFWMLEYVSKHNKRKDYEENFDKYENELKVPYFLLFYPETRDLTLYHHTGEKYVAVPADEHDRHAIPELELELGLHEGWVRYWFRGELLPLPADLQRALEEERRRADRAERECSELRQQLDQERQARLTLEREVERLRGGASS